MLNYEGKDLDATLHHVGTSILNFHSKCSLTELLALRLYEDCYGFAFVTTIICGFSFSVKPCNLIVCSIQILAFLSSPLISLNICNKKSQMLHGYVAVCS